MNLIARWRIWGAAASCALLLGLPLDAAAAGPHSKLDRHLQKTAKGDSGTYRVIIRTRNGQRGAVAGSVRQRGDGVYGDHPGVEGLSVEVSARTLRELEKNPDVESISTDADLDALDWNNSSSTSTTSTSTTSTSPLSNTIVSTLLTTLGLGNFGMGSTI